jgi:RNase H-fold protein (predicted Holliday junction resolvase)
MELCKVIGVDEPDLKVAVRLGNPKEGVVRPLKVVMNNKKHRKNILDNASKLKQLLHTSEFVKCIITKDLTVIQRELNKNRREERKKEIKQRVPKKPETI